MRFDPIGWAMDADRRMTRVEIKVDNHQSRIEKLERLAERALLVFGVLMILSLLLINLPPEVSAKIIEKVVAKFLG